MKFGWALMNETKLIETNKVLRPLAMYENWVVLLFGARFGPQKKIQAKLGNLYYFKAFWIVR
jgi:hypothetical protein